MSETWSPIHLNTVITLYLEQPFSYYQYARVLSPFHGGGIAYLNDPDSYAGWSFYTPVRTTQARQVEG